MLHVNAELCRDFDRSSKLEWLETNGAGGFAMGTVAGVTTRRYHGLLIASLKPPVSRFLLLSRLDESVLVEGASDIDLATNQYPGVVAPAGCKRLVEFRKDPFPTWVYELGGARLEKQLFLVQGEQTAVVLYKSTRAQRLRIDPMLAFRDHHSLSRANSSLDGRVSQKRSAGALTIGVRPYRDLPELTLHTSPAAAFAAGGAWYYNNELLEELDRGLDYREDLWRPGTFTLEVRPEETAFLVATVGEEVYDLAAVDKLERAERARRVPSSGSSFRQRLEEAAEQFVAEREDGTPTVLAGYPWFTDWGRDTMISLPGLLIARGRLDQAREVLRGFLRFLDLGLIPNRFPDNREEAPEYNTVDATLWLFQAAHAWLQAGGDKSFLVELYPAAKEILRWHLEGTHHGIHVDPTDGLLTGGEPGVQLTWMDARVGNKVMTPRQGKAVEINALYYNALCLASRWGESSGDHAGAAAYQRQAERVRQAFVKAFWNSSRGCLYDVVDGPQGTDASVRPNQIIAVSLPFPLLAEEQQRAVVGVVERELLTPVGLRTLARFEPGYIGHYRGTMAERDAAYHQGTVWPWLLGPYLRAYLNAFGRTKENILYCRSLLAPLERHLSVEACLGSVSEVFDGEAPHRPGGAPAQAWSVAELLQLVIVELEVKQA